MLSFYNFYARMLPCLTSLDLGLELPATPVSAPSFDYLSFSWQNTPVMKQLKTSCVTGSNLE